MLDWLLILLFFFTVMLQWTEIGIARCQAPLWGADVAVKAAYSIFNIEVP